MRLDKLIGLLGGVRHRFLSRRKVREELYRAFMFEKEGNVAGLIGMLASDVRGLTRYSIVRDHVATGLGRLGDPRAIPHLMELRGDPDKWVRGGVLVALGKLKAVEAESALTDALSDPAPNVRCVAAQALAQLGAVDVVPALYEALESDSDRWVRLSAVEALVILGDEGARARVPDALSAISWRARGPRWQRLREAAESGEPLTPYVPTWDH